MPSRLPTVFFANGIGDAILALPALRALAQHFQGRWQLVVPEPMGRLLFNELPATPLLEIPVKGIEKRFDPDAAATRLAPCSDFAALVPWINDDLRRLPQLLDAQGAIGFFPDYQTHLPRDYGKHTAHLNFDVVHHFNPDLRLEDFLAPPRLPPQDLARAASILKHIPNDHHILAVHADTAREKMWVDDHYANVLRPFLERFPKTYVLVVGITDIGLSALDTRVVPCFGTTLGVSLALVAAADCFLGVDSSMLHAADFFRVPGVGLFGPTDPNEFGFLVGPHLHVRGPEMAAVPVDAVLEALMRMAAEMNPTPRRHVV